MVATSENDILWTPAQDLRDTCAMSAFMREVSRSTGVVLNSYEELHTWAVAHPQLFWSKAAVFLSVVGAGALEPAYEPYAEGPTPLARRWFPNFQLNFAENLLRGNDSDVAVVSYSEDRLCRRYTRGELQRDVDALVGCFREWGIGVGDRVFAYIPNIPEAIVCMLATAAVGATWSSCGTDYQIDGVRARIERVQPTVLIAARSFLWRGVAKSLDAALREAQRACSTIKETIVVDYLQEAAPLSGAHRYEELVSRRQAAPLTYEKFPFNHPLYVMFSSGTTGKPKGIVHSAGGTLLEHKKEHVFHGDVRVGDKVFYQTSTSWMMWNWLVSGLASGATVFLFDGDPMLQDGMILWRMAEREEVTHFGTSAAFLAALEKDECAPKDEVQLKNLRVLFSTGSTLYPAQFDFVMKQIKPLWLQSISGGTDIIGCFGIGTPLKDVRRGLVQGRSLGYDVQVFDRAGKAAVEQEGELVCVAPAPSMPVSFLDDATGEAYQAAYFSEWPGVWRHGDFVRLTTDGELLFLGRSDATLKPSGVRVATADIYGVLQQLPAITQALAVGYTPVGSSTEQIVLFVVLGEGVSLTEEYADEIRALLRRVNVFYVPALILQAPDVPRTTNNKLAELTVKRILAGREEGNLSALANPESVHFFKTEALSAVIKLLG